MIDNSFCGCRNIKVGNIFRGTLANAKRQLCQFQMGILFKQCRKVRGTLILCPKTPHLRKDLPSPYAVRGQVSFLPPNTYVRIFSLCITSITSAS